MSSAFTLFLSFFFFFNDTATTEIYTLSLHDALPISVRADLPRGGSEAAHRGRRPGWTPRGRTLLRAHPLRRGRQLHEDRPGGDLRPGPVGHPVRVRRGRHPDGERLD